jgi:hypothetical protein
MDSKDSLLLQFSSKDADINKLIQENFAKQAKIIHSRQFDATLSDVIQCVIPLVPATVKFLFKYFAAQQGDLAKKRVLVTKDGEISIQGYSEKQVKAIVSEITKKAR